MRSLSFLALTVASIVAVPLARAEDPTELDDLPKAARERAEALAPEARPHFATGFRAFNNKDYKTASTEFEAAYKLDPQVPLLFTWAQSERLGGNCAHALELYQRYLYSDINEQQAEFARRWIKKCGGVVAATPPKREVPVTPSPADDRYIWYRDLPADGMAASGALGLLVGTIYLVKAKHAADTADTTHDLAVFKQSNADASHDNTVGAVAMTLGGLFALGGAGVYIYHAKTHHPVTVSTTVRPCRWRRRSDRAGSEREDRRAPGEPGAEHRRPGSGRRASPCPAGASGRS